MNPRTTGLLAVVALLLGGFVYFYELEGESAREAARDDELRIHAGLEADAVRAIELTSQDAVEARFERRDGVWWIVSPVEGEADAAALDAIAFALTQLPRAGSVPGADAVEPFGLGASARVVRFELDGAAPDETRGIRIGGETPVGGHVYVARLTDDEVAYVERYRLNALNRNLDDLRDRRIIGFEVADVASVSLSWPGPEAEVEIELGRDASDPEAWQIRAPFDGPADAQTVRDLLSDLAFLRASGFVDARDAATDAALAETLLEIRLQLTGEDASRRIRFGGKRGEQALVETGDGRVFTIEPERLEDFPRRLAAYRFKQLSEFEVAAAGRLELSLRSESSSAADAAVATTVVAELGDAGWSRSEGEPALDPDRISDLVRALAGLRAVDILAEEMGENERASLGLAPARVSIRVLAREQKDAPPLAEVSIGRLDGARGLFAQRAGDATIFVLPADAAEDLPVSLEAFEAEFVVPSSQAADGAGADPEPPVEVDPLEGLETP